MRFIARHAIAAFACGLSGVSALSRPDDSIARFEGVLEDIERRASTSEGIALYYMAARGRQSVLIAYSGKTQAFLVAGLDVVTVRDASGRVYTRIGDSGPLEEVKPRPGREMPGDASLDDFLVTPLLRSMRRTREFDRVVPRPEGGWIVTRPFSWGSREGPRGVVQPPKENATVYEYHLDAQGRPLREERLGRKRIIGYEYSSKSDDVWWFVEHRPAADGSRGWELMWAKKLTAADTAYFDPARAVEIVLDEVVRPARTMFLPGTASGASGGAGVSGGAAGASQPGAGEGRPAAGGQRKESAGSEVSRGGGSWMGSWVGSWMGGWVGGLAGVLALGTGIGVGVWVWRRVR